MYTRKADNFFAKKPKSISLVFSLHDLSMLERFMLYTKVAVHLPEATFEKIDIIRVKLNQSPNM